MIVQISFRKYRAENITANIQQARSLLTTAINVGVFLNVISHAHYNVRWLTNIRLLSQFPPARTSTHAG